MLSKIKKKRVCKRLFKGKKTILYFTNCSTFNKKINCKTDSLDENTQGQNVFWTVCLKVPTSCFHFAIFSSGQIPTLQANPGLSHVTLMFCSSLSSPHHSCPTTIISHLIKSSYSRKQIHPLWSQAQSSTSCFPPKWHLQ